jgi:ubiquinone/menaquinone biosynthesis C-methylase UbiE
MSTSSQYKGVIEANIALHTRLAAEYNTCEPHLRPENVAKVEANLVRLFSETGATRMLDLGCGTGFMIQIAKKYVKEIHGVDVTQAMMDEVDTSGDAAITLHNHDAGSFPVEAGSFDVVTSYSFLHHLFDIQPTLNTACQALRPGGKFYADLDPNFYFWEAIDRLDRDGPYDPIIKREIEAVTYKDEDIEKNFGIDRETFNQAEYGKNVQGGFKEEDLREKLLKAGFKSVEIFYYWYVGQGAIINDETLDRDERFRHAEVMDGILKRLHPLSRSLYKYVGFVATR